MNRKSLGGIYVRCVMLMHLRLWLRSRIRVCSSQEVKRHCSQRTGRSVGNRGCGLHIQAQHITCFQSVSFWILPFIGYTKPSKSSGVKWAPHTVEMCMVPILQSARFNQTNCSDFEACFSVLGHIGRSCNHDLVGITSLCGYYYTSYKWRKTTTTLPRSTTTGEKELQFIWFLLCGCT